MRTLMYADTPFTRQKVMLALDETVVKSTVSQSCKRDCLDFAERMKRKALRVRAEGSIPPYVTKAESRKQQKTNYYHAGAAGRVGVRDRGATPHRVYGRVR